jgi:hypothetical protein
MLLINLYEINIQKEWNCPPDINKSKMLKQYHCIRYRFSFTKLFLQETQVPGNEYQSQPYDNMYNIMPTSSVVVLDPTFWHKI